MSLSPHSLSLVWPTRSFHSSAASLCSRILLDYILSEEPATPTVYFMMQYQCVTPLHELLFRSFLKGVHTAKEYLWLHNFRKFPALLIRRCFREETFSVSQVPPTWLTCQWALGASEWETWLLAEEDTILILKKLWLEEKLSISQVSWWSLKICLLIFFKYSNTLVPVPVSFSIPVLHRRHVAAACPLCHSYHIVTWSHPVWTPFCLQKPSEV